MTPASTWTPTKSGSAATSLQLPQKWGHTEEPVGLSPTKLSSVAPLAQVADQTSFTLQGVDEVLAKVPQGLMLGVINKLSERKQKKRRRQVKAIKLPSISIRESAPQVPSPPAPPTKFKGKATDLASLDSNEDVVLVVEKERSLSLRRSGPTMGKIPFHYTCDVITFSFLFSPLHFFFSCEFG